MSTGFDHTDANAMHVERAKVAGWSDAGTASLYRDAWPYSVCDSAGPSMQRRASEQPRTRGVWNAKASKNHSLI
jgi:hypothetical protein